MVSSTITKLSSKINTNTLQHNRVCSKVTKPSNKTDTNTLQHKSEPARLLS